MKNLPTIHHVYTDAKDEKSLPYTTELNCPVDQPLQQLGLLHIRLLHVFMCCFALQHLIQKFDILS